MLKIEAIYNKGTAEEIEDGLLINPPFFGVIDGTSEPAHFIGKGLSFNKMSAGEMVRKIILETFYSAKSNDSLEKVILRANNKLKTFWHSLKIPLNRSDLVAGAVFVLAKIEKKKIKIIQGGDCFALWVTTSGTRAQRRVKMNECSSTKIGFTKNQAFWHSLEAQKVIAELIKKDKGNRKKMWLDFYKPLCQLRLRDINQKVKTGFALLNGQPSLKKCWQKIEIPTKNLKLLLLFSDGFAPFKKERQLAKETIKFYQRGGLNYVLQKKREFEEKTEKISYRVFDEATAIVIKKLDKN